jgi:hypothetical protein
MAEAAGCQAREGADVMALDPLKVTLVAEFLREAFPGCSIYDLFDRDRVAQLYRIVDDRSRKTLHHIFVSREFLDDHAEAEIIPTLHNLGLLVNLRVAGVRLVIVRSQTIEIETEKRAQ